MMLLVDIGNTRVKWARVQNGHLSIGTPLMHREQSLVVIWDTLWGAIPLPERVVVACVAGGGIAASLTAWCLAHWGVRPEFVSAGAAACGVSSGYRVPSELGVDRWLAMIAARQLPEFDGRALCVVGCGTALTVDVVTADGRHLGGWIAPGLGLMRQLLAQGTAVRTADTANVANCSEFGHGTAEAVTAGTLQAAAGMVLQAMALAQQRVNGVPLGVLTGGDADTLLPLLPGAVGVVPDLVLHGLVQLVGQQEIG
jgi:type III pantothenate kinase